MVQSFAVLEEAKTVVFQSVTLNLAAAVCDQLEGAGFPARLGKTSHGFAVLVPQEFAAQSRGLLIGHPQKREILN